MDVSLLVCCEVGDLIILLVVLISTLLNFFICRVAHMLRDKGKYDLNR